MCVGYPVWIISLGWVKIEKHVPYTMLLFINIGLKYHLNDKSLRKSFTSDRRDSLISCVPPCIVSVLNDFTVSKFMYYVDQNRWLLTLF